MKEERQRRDEEERKKKSVEVPGIIDLVELLNGSYRKRKKEEEIVKMKERKMKRKLSRIEIDYIPDESK